MNATHRIALDYRPALWSRAGIARSVRELVAALDQLEPSPEDVYLQLYGDCLRRAPSETGDPDALRSAWIRLRARRIPARLSQWIAQHHRSRAGFGSLDLLHTTDYVAPPFPDVPRVATLHDLSFLTAPEHHGQERSAHLERVTRNMLDGALAVVVPSHATAKDAQRLLGIAAETIHVIPHGGDHVHRILGAPAQTKPRSTARESRFDIVTLGTLEPRKNHLRCLRAFERLHREAPMARWIVIGRRGWLDEPFLAALEQSSARSAIEVHLRGTSDRAALTRLREADLSLYVSLQEGFGLPILEAQELAVAVLSSKGSATEEICGDAAELVDPRSEEEIFCALRSLWNDPERRHALAERGRLRAQRFRWQHAALAHLELWRHCLTSLRTKA